MVGPKDGRNGNCVVRLGGRYKGCEMEVKLVNGVREGTATVKSGGFRRMTFEYHHGSVTGLVELYSETGKVIMRGHLKDGIETGVFEEFHSADGSFKWRGYYQNGKRACDMTKRLIRKGPSNGKGIQKGVFYELDDKNKLSQLCEFKDGERVAILAKFSGNVLKEYVNGKKVYEGGFKGDDSGHWREGKGVEFDERGNAIYNGEWKRGKRNGMGTEFKDMKPVYEGEWKSGLKHGNGKGFDSHGKPRKGRWCCGLYEGDVEAVVKPNGLVTNAINVESIKIAKNSYNDPAIKTLELKYLLHVKRLEIEDSCFKYVRMVDIKGLIEMEEIVIGKKCFTLATSSWLGTEVEKQNEGSLTLRECYGLKSIQIGDLSFADYPDFNLINNMKLQSIVMGKYCFYHASSFALTG